MSSSTKLQTKLSYEKILLSIQELPTLPTIQAEIISAINDPMTSIKEIEELMLSDQGLTVKVLKLINSAYYAIPGGVKDLGRAIGFLGFSTINQLVLSTSIINSLKFSTAVTFDVPEFWKHSMGVAICCETSAKFLGSSGQDHFIAGLIHDIGKLALLKLDGQLVAEIAQRAREQKKSYLQIEIDNELPRHAMIGSLLAEKWKFPDHLKAAVKYHHTLDPKMRVGQSMELNHFIDLVAFSNLRMHQLAFGNSGYDLVQDIPHDLLQRLKIEGEAQAKLYKTIDQKLESSAQLLSIIMGGT